VHRQRERLHLARLEEVGLRPRVAEAAGDLREQAEIDHRPA